MLQKLFVAATALTAGVALASSHREAPAISQDPAVDISDLYVFPTPAKPTTHTSFILNVSPAYQAYAGPNWYRFADDAIYEVHIDVNGDGVEDTTYQFEFKTADYKGLGENALIVANFPAITYANGSFSGALSQLYKVTKIVGNRRTGTRTEIAKGLPVAPPRIGPYTTDGGAANKGDHALMYAAYNSLAANAIQPVGTSHFFAGPRNDPFFVDLGAVFDRVSPRIPEVVPGDGPVTGNPRDSLKGANVLTIAFDIPDADFGGESGKFGVWATASRPQAGIWRLGGKDSIFGGGYVQVSRLGNPLVNEVVIKINDKDKFNNTEPKDDAKNYAGYVVKPQLAYVLNFLYAGAAGATVPNFITAIKEDGRADLVAAFVDGLPNINKIPGSIENAGDMIRVNKAFGIQEWPLSGRQLKDDVVKAALTFLAQCTKLMANTGTPVNPYGEVEPPTVGLSPANCLLDDFVTAGDATPGGTTNGLIAAFPYIDAPHSSYFHNVDYPTYGP